ncbi:MAG: DUF885 domain-containing protein [Bacteroidota bacterium]
MKKALILFFLLFSQLALADGENRRFRLQVESFVKAYSELGIPELTFDFKEYFNAIPVPEKLNRQEVFFNRQDSLFRLVNPAKLKRENSVMLGQVKYEIAFNLERLQLEKNWHALGRPLPYATLYDMPEGRKWYAFFVKRFTSLETAPEEIMAFGLSEVKRINREIDSLQLKLGYKSRPDFYTFLRSDSFFITDKQQVQREFRSIDSTIRQHLPGFVAGVSIPPIYAMEWEGAGQFTPPGMYLSQSDNAYGRDVFLFNFYGGRFNTRALDWIYMHEAIPGHHLQHYFPTVIRDNPLTALFGYSGNFEGWACYIENYGQELGAYRNDLSYLGKCEWDLVRSARLVIETGVHTQGWSKEQALDFWNEHIYGFDDIAEREINRVSNWPGQALSYKLGADFIRQLKAKYQQQPGFSEQEFHAAFLQFSGMPLDVVSENFTAFYHP